MASPLQAVIEMMHGGLEQGKQEMNEEHMVRGVICTNGNVKDKVQVGQPQEGERTTQKAYEELKAAKEEEHEAGQDQPDAKSQEATRMRSLRSLRKTSRTPRSIGGDEDFLAMLKHGGGARGGGGGGGRGGEQ